MLGRGAERRGREGRLYISVSVWQLSENIWLSSRFLDEQASFQIRLMLYRQSLGLKIFYIITITFLSQLFFSTFWIFWFCLLDVWTLFPMQLLFIFYIPFYIVDRFFIWKMAILKILRYEMLCHTLFTTQYHICLVHLLLWSLWWQSMCIVIQMKENITLLIVIHSFWCSFFIIIIIILLLFR